MIPDDGYLTNIECTIEKKKLLFVGFSLKIFLYPFFWNIIRITCSQNIGTGILKIGSKIICLYIPLTAIVNK